MVLVLLQVKASGIAAFYSATARFVQWLGSLPNKENWVRNQDMLDHTSWNAPDLQSLTELHSTMLHTYHCIEASSPSQHNDDAQPANGSQDTHPLSLPSLNSLALTHDSLEDGDADVFIPILPPQKRITSQILKHWQPHTDARLHASERDKALFKLHNCQRIDAIPSEDAGEAAQSILARDMPIPAESVNCDKKKLNYSPMAFLSSVSAVGFAQTSFTHDDWTSWMCLILGLTPPPVVQYVRQQCSCGRHVIDEFGDHVISCKKYGQNRADCHRILLKALQSICQRAGYSSEIKNVPTSNGKRRADLFIKHINLAGRQDLILDVSVIHEFHGDVMQDVGRNGNLRHRDPTSPILLDNKALRKVNLYREDYRRPGRSDRAKAFLCYHVYKWAHPR